MKTYRFRSIIRPRRSWERPILSTGFPKTSRGFDICRFIRESRENSLRTKSRTTLGLENSSSSII